MTKCRNLDQDRSRSHEQLDRFIGVVHFGEAETEIAVVGKNQYVLNQITCAFTGSPAHANRWRSKVASALQKLAHNAKVRISGIGITFARNIDCQNRNSCTPFFTGRQRHELTRDLIGRFRVPVATADDTDAVLLAEQKWGAQRGKSTLVQIEIGTTGCAAALVETKYPDGSLGGDRRPATF